MKEKAMPSLEKPKFGRKATEDAKSIFSSKKEKHSAIILIGTIPISLNCLPTSPTLLPSSSKWKWRKT